MLKPITHINYLNMAQTTQSTIIMSPYQSQQQIDSKIKSGFNRLRNREIHTFTDVGLDNNILISYIHQIYSKYGIQDPLSNYKQNRLATTQTSDIKEIKENSGRKIAKLKNSFRMELERTAVQSQSGLSRIDRVYDQSAQYTLTDNNEQETHHYYRYCIICEAMIQNTNILKHQKRCAGYDNLYKMSAPQLIGFLKNKLVRLETQIMETLKVREEFKEEPIKEFLKQVNKQRVTANLERNYMNLVDSLPKKALNILELSYKIRWFRKVMEQIQIKFIY